VHGPHHGPLGVAVLYFSTLLNLWVWLFPPIA
jgi:hypothetical protein